MIYITGDTHGSFRRFTIDSLDSLNITSDDYIIVCGDFGLCWQKGKEFEDNCSFFEKLPVKAVLFVQGNHENYDMLDEYDLEPWNGGVVRHIVRDKVILLERGQVFNIEGKTFFTFGGGKSFDIQGGLFDQSDPDLMLKIFECRMNRLPYRIRGLSWWYKELPSQHELNVGLSNLNRVGNKVDYVITHCASNEIVEQIAEKDHFVPESDCLTDYFSMLESRIEYKKWFFGHYHHDYDVDSKHTLLYYDILSLDWFEENVGKEGK